MKKLFVSLLCCFTLLNNSAFTVHAVEPGEGTEPTQETQPENIDSVNGESTENTSSEGTAEENQNKNEETPQISENQTQTTPSETNSLTGQEENQGENTVTEGEENQTQEGEPEPVAENGTGEGEEGAEEEPAFTEPDESRIYHLADIIDKETTKIEIFDGTGTLVSDESGYKYGSKTVTSETKLFVKLSNFQLIDDEVAEHRIYSMDLPSELSVVINEDDPEATSQEWTTLYVPNKGVEGYARIVKNGEDYQMQIFFEKVLGYKNIDFLFQFDASIKEPDEYQSQAGEISLNFYDLGKALLIKIPKKTPPTPQEEEYFTITKKGEWMLNESGSSTTNYITPSTETYGIKWTVEIKNNHLTEVKTPIRLRETLSNGDDSTKNHYFPGNGVITVDIDGTHQEFKLNSNNYPDVQSFYDTYCSDECFLSSPNEAYGVSSRVSHALNTDGVPGITSKGYVTNDRNQAEYNYYYNNLYFDFFPQNFDKITITYQTKPYFTLDINKTYLSNEAHLSISKLESLLENKEKTVAVYLPHTTPGYGASGYTEDSDGNISINFFPRYNSSMTHLVLSLEPYSQPRKSQVDYALTYDDIAYYHNGNVLSFDNVNILNDFYRYTFSLDSLLNSTSIPTSSTLTYGQYEFLKSYAQQVKNWRSDVTSYTFVILVSKNDERMIVPGPTWIYALSHRTGSDNYPALLTTTVPYNDSYYNRNFYKNSYEYSPVPVDLLIYQPDKKFTNGNIKYKKIRHTTVSDVTEYGAYKHYPYYVNTLSLPGLSLFGGSMTYSNPVISPHSFDISGPAKLYSELYKSGIVKYSASMPIEKTLTKIQTTYGASTANEGSFISVYGNKNNVEYMLLNSGSSLNTRGVTFDSDHLLYTDDENKTSISPILYLETQNSLVSFSGVGAGTMPNISVNHDNFSHLLNAYTQSGGNLSGMIRANPYFNSYSNPEYRFTYFGVPKISSISSQNANTTDEIIIANMTGDYDNIYNGVYLGAHGEILSDIAHMRYNVNILPTLRSNSFDTSDDLTYISNNVVHANADGHVSLYTKIVPDNKDDLPLANSFVLKSVTVNGKKLEIIPENITKSSAAMGEDGNYDVMFDFALNPKPKYGWDQYDFNDSGIKFNVQYAKAPEVINQDNATNTSVQEGGIVYNNHYASEMNGGFEVTILNAKEGQDYTIEYEYELNPEIATKYGKSFNGEYVFKDETYANYKGVAEVSNKKVEDYKLSSKSFDVEYYPEPTLKKEVVELSDDDHTCNRYYRDYEMNIGTGENDSDFIYITDGIESISEDATDHSSSRTYSPEEVEKFLKYTSVRDFSLIYVESKDNEIPLLKIDYDPYTGTYHTTKNDDWEVELVDASQLDDIIVPEGTEPFSSNLFVYKVSKKDGTKIKKFSKFKVVYDAELNATMKLAEDGNKTFREQDFYNGGVFLVDNSAAVLVNVADNKFVTGGSTVTAQYLKSKCLKKKSLIKSDGSTTWRVSLYVDTAGKAPKAEEHFTDTMTVDVPAKYEFQDELESLYFDYLTLSDFKFYYASQLTPDARTEITPSGVDGIVITYNELSNEPEKVTEDGNDLTKKDFFYVSAANVPYQHQVDVEYKTNFDYEGFINAAIEKGYLTPTEAQELANIIISNYGDCGCQPTADGEKSSWAYPISQKTLLSKTLIKATANKEDLYGQTLASSFKFTISSGGKDLTEALFTDTLSPAEDLSEESLKNAQYIQNNFSLKNLHIYYDNENKTSVIGSLDGSDAVDGTISEVVDGYSKTFFMNDKDGTRLPEDYNITIERNNNVLTLSFPVIKKDSDIIVEYDDSFSFDDSVSQEVYSYETSTSLKNDVDLTSKQINLTSFAKWNAVPLKQAYSVSKKSYGEVSPYRLRFGITAKKTSGVAIRAGDWKLHDVITVDDEFKNYLYIFPYITTNDKSDMSIPSENEYNNSFDGLTFVEGKGYKLSNLDTFDFTVTPGVDLSDEPYEYLYDIYFDSIAYKNDNHDKLVDNKNISILNKVTLNVRDLDAGTSNASGNLVITPALDKTGAHKGDYTMDGKPILDWTIDVNLLDFLTPEELLKMTPESEFTVSEELANYLSLVEGSLKVYQMIKYDTGTYKPNTVVLDSDKYKVEYLDNNRGFNLTYLSQENPYVRLMFKTTTDAAAEDIRNTVSADVLGKLATKTPDAFDTPFLRFQNGRVTSESINIKILKVEAFSKVAIEGAKLHIEDNSATVHTYETPWISSTEPHLIEAIPVGTYTLVEDEAPVGYEKAPSVMFSVNSNGTVTILDENFETLSFENKLKEYDVSISKTEVNGTDELVGAKLSITGKTDGGEEIEEISWTSDGSNKSVKLAAGSYTLTETQAPENYVAAESIDFTVNLDGSITVNGEDVEKVHMQDEVKLGSVKISKEVRNYPDYEQPFEFTLKMTRNEKPSKNVVKITKSGQTEELTPSDEGTVSFTLSDGEEATISDIPYGTAYEFTEKDYSSAGFTTEKENNTGIIGEENKTVKFLNSSNNIKVRKVDSETNSALSGATMHIENKTIVGKFNEAWTSSEEDKTIYGIPAGTYTLIEDRAPNGYDKIESFEFVVNENGTVTYDGKTSDTLIVNNTLMKFPVSISKTDINGTTELKGATLSVSGTKKNGTKIETIKWVSDGKDKVLNLEEGTYTLVENIAPENYRTAEDITFQVDSTGKITVNDSEVEKVVMKDERKNSNLKISKSVTKTSSEIEEPFNFTIKLTEDGVPAKNISFNIAGKTDSISTDDNGEYKFSVKAGESVEFQNIPQGLAYTVTEDDYSSEGYVTSSKNASGTISEENDTVSFTNRMLSVSVQKIREDGSLLPGAKLHIDDGKEGTMKFEEQWESSTSPHLVENIPVGEYTLVEDNAPEGYTKAEDIKFSIKEDGSVVCNQLTNGVVTMTNTLSSFDIHISKVDINGDKELKGAKLSLSGTTSEGKVMNEITWMSDGNDKVVKLKPGTYTLTENQAPQYYETAESITFTVTNNGKVEIAGNEAEKVIMKDARKSGSISVSKTVKGAFSDENDEFEFTMTLKDGENPAANISFKLDDGNAKTVSTDENGMVSFKLKHDNTVTFSGIPQGIKYSVAEKDYSDIGYTKVIKKNDSGTVKEDTAKVEFLNINDGTIPTGIFSNFTTTVVVGAMLVLCAIVYFLVFFKKREN